MNSSPSKQSGCIQNLYEIPSCTICLQVLSEDLSSLDCGHVFHLGCIGQHFQYKGTCPNCQKRASLKEVRTIHYQPIHNNKANAQILSILSSVDPSEKKQIDNLVKEILKITANYDRVTSQNNSNKITMKKQNQLVESLRKQIHRFKIQHEKLKKDNAGLTESNENLQGELNQHLKIQMKLRIDLDKLKGEERQFEHMRKLSKLITERSQQIVQFREQLISRGTSFEQMAKNFYDMLLMKNLQMLRLKEKLRDFPQKMNQRQMEVARLKSSVELLRKELRQLNDKKNQERKRYDDLKNKYRTLSEKAKQKGVKDYDIPQMDDSQGFNTLKKNFYIPEIPTAQLTLKKPLFNQSTIGGFISKKKDERLQKMMTE